MSEKVEIRPGVYTLKRKDRRSIQGEETVDDNYVNLGGIDNWTCTPAPSAASGEEEDRSTKVAALILDLATDREWQLSVPAEQQIRTVAAMIDKHAAHIRQQEQERCAKVAKEHEECERECGNTQAEMSAQRIAAAIRSGE